MAEILSPYFHYSIQTLIERTACIQYSAIPSSLIQKFLLIGMQKELKAKT